jgi:hypothetical protein
MYLIAILHVTPLKIETLAAPLIAVAGSMSGPIINNYPVWEPCNTLSPLSSWGKKFKPSAHIDDKGHY